MYFVKTIYYSVFKAVKTILNLLIFSSVCHLDIIDYVSLVAYLPILFDPECFRRLIVILEDHKELFDLLLVISIDIKVIVVFQIFSIVDQTVTVST